MKENNAFRNEGDTYNLYRQLYHHDGCLVGHKDPDQFFPRFVPELNPSENNAKSNMGYASTSDRRLTDSLHPSFHFF
jgi:hypothetical protein